MVVLPLSSTSRGRSRLVQWFSGSALALCCLPSSPRSWPLVKARCICRRWVCINQFANVPAAGSYAYIRRTSDRLCKEHGLSVVMPGQDRGKSYAEWDAHRKGTSWKAKLKTAIDAAIPQAKDFDDFLRLLQEQGYEVKRGK